MKTPIGEIVDKFTICKLKNERLNIDLTKELNELLFEIKLYDNIDIFVDLLYEINGKIWDLESDIRKGNEHILGLEEIGRRALLIRDLNAIRVGYKNQINSKYVEGYVEYKMNHGSETEKSLIISLTTVPERLLNDREDGLKLVLKSLCEQKDDDYEVHFNVPHIYNMTNEKYIIPNWLEDYKLKYQHLKIFRTEDFGPPTKFVPTLYRIQNNETILLVVDDDLVYHDEMVYEHRKYQKQLMNSAIGYDGRGCDVLLHNNDIRDSWILCVTSVRKTHSLQHYKSISYKRKLFNEMFFKNYIGSTLSDDMLISTYFRDENISMYVVPYEKENHLFETRELWDKHQGVTTFPVLRYASSVENTGCNHPNILNIQPKFFDPTNIIRSKKLNNVDNNGSIILGKFNTDKINHGYMEIYEPIFEKIKNSKKILEIGIDQGESLKMLSYFFKDGIVYGIDINDKKYMDNEKIKTYICNQESIDDLEKFISYVGDNFDLIIDDGGHTMKQQQTSFGFLFKHLNKGGIYIIEDLHTSLLEGWKNDNDNITTLDMLNRYNKEGRIFSNYISKDNLEYINNNIDSLNIWSRTPDFKESVTSIIVKK